MLQTESLAFSQSNHMRIGRLQAKKELSADKVNIARKLILRNIVLSNRVQLRTDKLHNFLSVGRPCAGINTPLPNALIASLHRINRIYKTALFAYFLKQTRRHRTAKNGGEHRGNISPFVSQGQPGYTIHNMGLLDIALLAK